MHRTLALPPEARAYDEATILRAERDELLAALRQLVAAVGDAQGDPSLEAGMRIGTAWHAARAAIAKAEGRSPSAPFPAPASTG